MFTANRLDLIMTLVTALATAVNCVLMMIMIQVTKRYVQITGEILKAAKSQANAAQAQATAAVESLRGFREQIEEQLGLGQHLVQTAISSAVKQIEYWRALEITLPASRSLPPTDDLVPANATSAVEQARRLSADGARHLSEAFDYLRLARVEIEAVKQAGREFPAGGCRALVRFATSIISPSRNMIYERTKQTDRPLSHAAC